MHKESDILRFDVFSKLQPGDGPVSAKNRQLIRSTWEKAMTDGDVAPQILLR